MHHKLDKNEKKLIWANTCSLTVSWTVRHCCSWTVLHCCSWTVLQTWGRRRWGERGWLIRTRIVPVRSQCCTLARSQCCTPERIILIQTVSGRNPAREKRDKEEKPEEWTCSFTVEHCSSYFSMYCVSHFCSWTVLHTWKCLLKLFLEEMKCCCEVIAFSGDEDGDD